MTSIIRFNVHVLGILSTGRKSVFRIILNTTAESRLNRGIS